MISNIFLLRPFKTFSKKFTQNWQMKSRCKFQKKSKFKFKFPAACCVYFFFILFGMLEFIINLIPLIILAKCLLGRETVIEGELYKVFKIRLINVLPLSVTEAKQDPPFSLITVNSLTHSLSSQQATNPLR